MGAALLGVTGLPLPLAGAGGTTEVRALVQRADGTHLMTGAYGRVTRGHGRRVVGTPGCEIFEAGVDLIVDHTGTAQVLELNSRPGRYGLKKPTPTPRRRP